MSEKKKNNKKHGHVGIVARGGRPAVDRRRVRTQTRAPVESQVKSLLTLAPVAAGRVRTLAVLTGTPGVRTLVDILKQHDGRYYTTRESLLETCQK